MRRDMATLAKSTRVGTGLGVAPSAAAGTERAKKNFTFCCMAQKQYWGAKPLSEKKSLRNLKYQFNFQIFLAPKL